MSEQATQRFGLRSKENQPSLFADLEQKPAPVPNGPSREKTEPVKPQNNPLTVTIDSFTVYTDSNSLYLYGQAVRGGVVAFACNLKFFPGTKNLKIKNLFRSKILVVRVKPETEVAANIKGRSGYRYVVDEVLRYENHNGEIGESALSAANTISSFGQR